MMRGHRGGLLPSQQQQPANHANLQLYNQVLPTSGTMALDLGNFFFLLSSASGSLALTLQYGGPTENMQGIPVGLQISRVKNWQSALLKGTPGAAVSFFHGYAFTRQDWTNFQATIATIAGSVTIVPGVGSTNSPTDRADTVVAGGGTAAIAANALRKSITIGSLASNNPATTNLRIQGTDGVGGVELQPGTYYNIATAAALNIFNGDANNQTVWIQEYT
jgi:hypothetical protein